MKSKITFTLSLIITACIFSPYIVKAQTNSAALLIEPIPGYVFPTTVYPTILTTGNGQSSRTAQLVSATDGTDMRIYPSANPQSEVHISINKTNQNNILVSAQTTWGNSIQGYYYTNNGGLSWHGSDHLANSANGRGDPSTAFDAQGYGYNPSKHRRL